MVAQQNMKAPIERGGKGRKNSPRSHFPLCSVTHSTLVGFTLDLQRSRRPLSNNNAVAGRVYSLQPPTSTLPAGGLSIVAALHWQLLSSTSWAPEPALPRMPKVPRGPPRRCRHPQMRRLRQLHQRPGTTSSQSGCR